MSRMLSSCPGSYPHVQYPILMSRMLSRAVGHKAASPWHAGSPQQHAREMMNGAVPAPPCAKSPGSVETLHQALPGQEELGRAGQAFRGSL